MKSLINVLLLFVFISGIANAISFAPPIAPLVPPDPPLMNEIFPSPEKPALNEYKSITEEAGYFSMHQDADLSGFYMLNRSGRLGLFGLLGGIVNFHFEDPWQLGKRLGLAKDAVEFKAGSGLILGFDVNGLPYFSIPAQAETTVFLKESSFYDLDPFIGAGLNMNILGTDFQIGGLGIMVYCGVLKQFGPAENKIALSIGYGGYQINNARNIEGLFFKVSQPMRL